MVEMPPSPWDPWRAVWLAWSSSRTTALLVVLFAGVAVLSVVVPQGREALEYARSEHATTLQALIGWGLSDVFSSRWVQALAVLLAANAVAVFVRLLGTPGDRRALVVPSDAPLSEELDAPAPELATMAIRGAALGTLGVSPSAESFEGSRVTMVFDSGRAARFAPLLAHLGLALLVMGAALARSSDPASTIPYGIFDVKDLSTQKVGRFDMAAHEPFQLFQGNAQYVLREYVRDRSGLGPAVRFDRVDTEQSPTPFWVYLLAPTERTPDGRVIYFDERHRQDRVGFQAIDLGIRPVPGHGPGASRGAVLIVLGAGALLAGLLFGARAAGRFWIVVDGRRIQILGVPERAGDPAFEGGFRRLLAAARYALSPSS